MNRKLDGSTMLMLVGEGTGSHDTGILLTRWGEFYECKHTSPVIAGELYEYEVLLGMGVEFCEPTGKQVMPNEIVLHFFECTELDEASMKLMYGDKKT